jgi:hypothetical protein
LKKGPDNLALNDLVLRRIDAPFRESKLSLRYKGPYLVTNIKENDITIKHLAIENIVVSHIDRLKIFTGTLAEAKELAMRDADQHWLEIIVAYKGDSNIKKSLSFLILFADNDLIWVPFSKDISETTQFESFCEINRELRYLLVGASLQKNFIRSINACESDDMYVGFYAYTKLRFFGYDWFESLNLPVVQRVNLQLPPKLANLTHLFTKDYVMMWEVIEVKKRNNYVIRIPILNGYTFKADRYWISSFGYIVFDFNLHISIDQKLLTDFPAILKSFKKRGRVV